LKRIKVKYRKLGKYYGLAHSTDFIEVDERIKGKKHLEILLHESLHIIFPSLDEDEIIAKSVILTNTLWHEKYRRIEDQADVPLQDGSK